MIIKRTFSITALMLAAITSSGCSQPSNSASDATSPKEIWPTIETGIKSDAQMEQKIADMLKNMTLEQKIAQMIQPEIRNITVEDMRKYGFGSYLNGGGSFPNNNKHATPEDWVDLAEKMYQASIDDSLDGSTIPTMWGTDAVHGHNKKVKNMVKNRKLSKHIHDANFGEIVRQLEYKADWYGRKVSAISQWFPSSKMCNECGSLYSGKWSLAIRTWSCECGAIHDRDHNAAINIHNEGLRLIA